MYIQYVHVSVYYIILYRMRPDTVHVIVYHKNNMVRVTLNENIKINDLFINEISRIPFLKKILIK